MIQLEKILNMILYDKFKIGIPVIDVFVTTIVLTIFSYFFQYIKDNVDKFISFIKTCDYELYFYNKNIVEYEGKIALTTTYYDNNLNQTNSFSNRFKALWINIMNNLSDNQTIKHIKEYSFDNYINKNKRDFGIYMVVQNKKFLISKKHQIYALTIINNEIDDDNKSKKNRIEKIIIQLFSYKSDITPIYKKLGHSFFVN